MDKTQNLDPNVYGYFKDQKIPFDGNTLLMIAAFAEKVAQRNTQVLFNISPEEKDGQLVRRTPQETHKTMTEYVNDLGLMAIEVYEHIMSNHMANIESKVAVHQEELFKENQFKLKVEK